MKSVFGKYAVAIAVGMLSMTAVAQLPLNAHIQILRAEDSLKFDASIERHLGSANATLRERAALAAGRIGDAKALPKLAELLAGDPSNDVRAMAAFAIGEIESIDGAEALLKLVAVAMPADREKASAVIARAVEAAGKIAAANPRDPRSIELGKAIVAMMENERVRGADRDRLTVLLGLTAIIRAIPVGGEAAAASFLTDTDGRIREDAGNTLARIRANNANEQFRKMLAGDTHPEARANAARGLAVGDDKDAAPTILRAALSDRDQRVRVASIRALSTLKSTASLSEMLRRADELYQGIKKATTRNFLPADRSEFLEYATAIGRIAQGTKDAAAYRLLVQFSETDGYRSSEVETALARIDPARYIAEASSNTFRVSDHVAASAFAQGFSEIAALKNEDLNAAAGKKLTAFFQQMLTNTPARLQGEMLKAIPSLSRSLAALKPDNLEEILRANMTIDDVQVRAATAGLLADLPPKPETYIALLDAFKRSLVTDRNDNDAQLATLNAIFKQDKPTAIMAINEALNARDHLVRRRAIQLLNDKEAWKDVPANLVDQAKAAAARGDRETVWRHTVTSRTRLGQVLNSDVDYRRALSRKNGSVKAVVTTQKGRFTIDLLPEDAPLTVDNFVKLARRGYFNGLAVHRVVPNFVMQDGDPRGDGTGGPGWSIRCEMNMVPFERGYVGMALSGKDTGGSQWFVTHAAQPHLDGGYTVFGRVNESDMNVVDTIVRGDKILTVRIIGR